MEKRAIFGNRALPYLLLAPQLAITLAFFIWPACLALGQSVTTTDAFGDRVTFVGLDNFVSLFQDPRYFESMRVTVVFSFFVALIGMSLSLLLAVLANRQLRGASGYKLLLIWPYAVAPALAGVLWGFLFNPRVGVLPYFLAMYGIEWNHRVVDNHALALIIMAACWNQISYNFVFFLAGLQSIPKSLVEAAAIDGAGAVRRFWTIVFPLLSPTIFFLAVVNVVYAFFGTFGLVDAMTKGGPANATSILVYKVYVDGFRGQDFGSSAAQSAILMSLVIGLTVLQFRFLERRVHY